MLEAVVKNSAFISEVEHSNWTDPVTAHMLAFNRLMHRMGANNRSDPKRGCIRRCWVRMWNEADLQSPNRNARFDSSGRNRENGQPAPPVPSHAAWMLPT